MIVVSDTSPINYLVLIGHVQVLHSLFDQVFIPDAVYRELQNPGTPPKVISWMAVPPPWLSRKSVTSTLQGEAFDRLGAGEQKAIELAAVMGDSVTLLIDERRGRAVAEGLNIRTIGVLGILEAAAEHGLIDLPSAINLLTQTSFYVQPSILKALVDRHREKNRG